MSMPLFERFSSSPSRKAYANPVTHLRPVAPVDLDATLPVLPRPLPAEEVLPMRCLSCQGTVRKSTAPVTVVRGGHRLAWKAVPAWVCSRCETPYFEPPEVEQIRLAVRAIVALSRE